MRTCVRGFGVIGVGLRIGTVLFLTRGEKMKQFCFERPKVHGGRVAFLYDML